MFLVFLARFGEKVGVAFDQGQGVVGVIMEFPAMTQPHYAETTHTKSACSVCSEIK